MQDLNIYEENFYELEKTVSLSNAEIILPYILNKIHCTSVVDFGCGAGEWLKVAKSLGVVDVLGLDGEYARKYIVIENNEFEAVDFTNNVVLDKKYDLAISLEVAEHLPTESSKHFIQTITKYSDIVLFSAAIPGQGGTMHINEQWPSFWKELFYECGFELCDVLRKQFWNNQHVESFYKQNMFIYCKKEMCHAIKSLFDCDNQVIDIVHPQLFELRMKNEQYIFPFNDVNKNSKVIIYGAGACGKAFVNQCLTTGYVELVLWCDSSYEIYETNMPVKPPKSIMDSEYDFIVIAIQSKKTAMEVQDYLINMGIPKNKIIWRDTKVVNKY